MGEELPLRGRTALVTGGGTGIGLGCARQLLRAGATVTIVGRREEVLKSAAADLEREVSPGAEVRWLRCDVTVEEDVRQAVGAACDARGHLDIAVANAGTGVLAPVLTATAQEWQHALNLNVLGTVLTIKHAALAMKDSGGGSIIVISSGAAVQVMRYLAPYSVSKAGLEMVVYCAADELARFGIRVNCLRPGYVGTPATEFFTEELRSQILSHTPLGRPGLPEEVGDAVCFLAGPGTEWITGQIFGVDGGLTVPRGEDFAPLLRRVRGDEAMEFFRGPGA